MKRISQYLETDTARGHFLDGHYVLLKNEANRTQKQDEIFKVIQEANLQVSLAWRLREEFKGIFECPSFAEAKTYFKLWLASVQNAAVKEVIKIAEMFERHFDGVCNALCHEQSNGVPRKCMEVSQ